MVFIVQFLFSKTAIKSFFCFCLLAVLCLAQNHAVAQSPPVDPADIPASCDPDYMDVLNARSYIEAKREMESAQRIILKPDSVLEYSCFNEEETWIADNAGRFSEFGLITAGRPPEFDGTRPPFRVLPNSLDEALADTVRTSLVGFLDSFSHIYGGGTFPIIPNPLAGCNSMNIVWFVSKCQQFDRNWWVRFEDLSATDVRLFPIPCLPVYDTTRAANINAALPASYPAPIDPLAPPVPGTGAMDRLDSFLPFYTGACTGPLETGMDVVLIDGTIVRDAVCVQPKCYFDGTTCVGP